MTPTTLRAAVLFAALPLAAADAQQVRVFSGSPREIEIIRGSVVMDRPVLGLTLVDDSERADTLGLRVSDVTPESPAQKAGLKAGDRLQSINGTSLRANRADAGEDDYDGVLMRRLQREMEKVKAGDTVRLQVLSEGRSREVRVVPVRADELYQNERSLLRRRVADDRPVIGVTTSPSGNARDTLGVFVSAVTEDGPAAKAGIIEGDRIAAVNGVSLRVAREDAGDAQVAIAKANRLRSELAKVESGQTVELTVVSAGRSRTVRVTPVLSSTLPGNDGGFFMWTAPPVPPTPPVPPVAPTAPTRGRVILRDVRVL